MRSIAVIGCGHWGPNHVRVFRSLPGVEVRFAVDPRPDRREHVAALYPGVRGDADPAAALADPALDAVVVATPAASHHEIALRAIRAGKHVLCEKPLCTTSAGCRELVAEARERGVVLMVGHVFLFNPGILKLAALVRDGAVGAVSFASAVRTNLGPIRDDVDVSFDLVSHEVSIFNFLLGAPPESVSALGRAQVKPPTHDVCFVNLRYPGDVLVGVTASWLSPRKVREITLVGDRKMVTWNDLSSSPIAIYDKGVAREPYYDSFGEFQLVTREGDVTIPRVEPEEPLLAQARFFREAVARGDAGECRGERGWEVVSTLEAVAESMRAGGSPVAVEPWA
jgi:predicted dehydrogenase